MLEWLGREWWQYVWIPFLGLAVPLGGVLIARMKNREDAESAREAALDGRQERWIITQEHEIKTLRLLVGEKEAKLSHQTDVLDWWHQKAHELRHLALNSRHVADSHALMNGYPPYLWEEIPILPGRNNPPLNGES